MRWLVYCDESGDIGFPVKDNSSRAYVVVLMLYNADRIGEIRELIRTSKRLAIPRGGRLEWKRLSSAEKKNDPGLTAFWQALIRAKGQLFLPMTVLANKLEIKSSGLKDSQEGRLIAYTYGLAFKRIAPFLDLRKDSAEVFIDRNSSPQIQQAVKKYVSEILPTMRELNMLWRYRMKTNTRYKPPVFESRKKDPCHQLADFCAGYTRAVFEDYLYHHNTNIIYRNSWKVFSSLHYKRLSNWRWDGLLYHPYENRENHPALF